MIRIIIVVYTLINMTFSLEPDRKNDEEIKKIILKYINKIPDLEPKYIMSEGISNMISQHYKGKINTFPLYKVSLKIDRNPVKIPWTLGQPNIQNQTLNGKHYKYVRVKKPDIK